MARSLRTRLDVLTGRARIAGALIIAFIWPVLCVRLTWVALHRVAFTTPASHVAAGAGILIAIAFATMVPRPMDRVRARSTWIGVVAVGASSLAAFVVLAAVAGAPFAIVLAPFALATWVAALAEEAVFRSFVPDRLADVLRHAGAEPAIAALAVVVIPQLSFAVAHAENSAFTGAGPREFVVLFAAGMLYQGVARVGGLWAATAVHAALNLTIGVRV